MLSDSFRLLMTGKSKVTSEKEDGGQSAGESEFGRERIMKKEDKLLARMRRCVFISTAVS